jgi:D-hydroxyproline dehydrogenase subunit beta
MPQTYSGVSVGSSRHVGETSGDVDEEAVSEAIIEQACMYMPSLATHLRASETRSKMIYKWGPRPASCRSLPYISAVHGCSGLVIAAGHEGSGLTMALSTAEIVGALLTNSQLPDYADAFAV